MMGDAEGARADYRLAISLGWDASQDWPGSAPTTATRVARSRGSTARWRALVARPSASFWLLADKAQIAARFGFAEAAEIALADLAPAGRDLIPAVQAIAIEARAELEVTLGRPSPRHRRAPTRPPGLDWHSPRLSRQPPAASDRRPDGRDRRRQRRRFRTRSRSTSCRAHRRGRPIRRLAARLCGLALLTPIAGRPVAECAIRANVGAARARSPLDLPENRISHVRPGASHSLSFDQRLRPEAFLTAMATALDWPTSTTNCLPRVTPV